MLNIDAYLKKSAKTIFFTFAIVSTLGYTIDVINFYHTSTWIFYNNCFTISVTIIFLLLYFLKKINLRVSFCIILYAAIFNVIGDTFSDPFAPNRTYFFLRDSLFITFVITLTSLIVHKVHAVIMTSIYTVVLIMLTLLTRNSFLLSSIYIIVMFVCCYAIVVYYIVGVVEKTIHDREQNTVLMEAANQMMNETNTLLEERQQQIEEQSEELTRQTEVLKDQSDQMELKNIELSQTNKTKDLFLSIMAHDLKNPFHAIMGFSEILEERFDKLDDEKKLKYINIISATSKKAYNLLENLLQWGRTQSNAIEYNPTKVAINGLVKENLYFFMESYRNKKIRIVENIQPNCYALADENMMNTTIRNLLSNAIKFTPEKGSIFINCKQEKDQILVEMKDTGVGIEQEDLENLFRIGKTYSTEGTNGETGTGLGLVLCKEFIEKNKGLIWVTSEKDKGSTFGFSLPAYPEK